MPISGAVYSVIQVIGFKATHGAKYPIFLNLLIYLNYLLFPNDIMSFLTDTIQILNQNQNRSNKLSGSRFKNCVCRIAGKD